MELLPYGNVPRDFTRRFNICAVDELLTHYTASEITRLDKYARGEITISESELKRIENQVDDRVGSTDGLLRGMKERCPDVIADGEKLKQKNS